MKTACALIGASMVFLAVAVLTAAALASAKPASAGSARVARPEVLLEAVAAGRPIRENPSRLR